MHTPDMTTVAALAAEHAEQADRDGRMNDKVVHAISESGILRHFTPHAWGGAQGTFATSTADLTLLSRADPSAGWCAAVMASMSRMAAYLPPDGQQAIWRDGPDTRIVGTLQPAGTATTTDGGWNLSGQWPFVSGVDHAQWALLCTHAPAPSGGSQMRFLLVPRSACAVTKSWESVGLRATGSHTLTVEHAFVPTAHTFTRTELFSGAAAHATGQCHRVPHEAVSGLFFAVPLLGAAQALLEEWVIAARRRTAAPAGSARDTNHTLGVVCGQIASAELLIQRAAATADVHNPAPHDQVVRGRLDCATAADQLIEAANRLFHEAGARATSNRGPLPRLWRDANTAATHPALNLRPAAHAFAEHLLAP